MPYASRRDPDDLEGLAAALEALVGTEYEEQVFIWVDGAPEGRTLDVVHTADDDVDGVDLAPTLGLVLPTDDEDPDDDWAEPEGRYLVYVGYVPGPPFVERDLPIPAGTVLVDDDGAGATVALPDLPVAALIEVLGSWARGALGGAEIGGLWWSTTFDDDDEDDDDGTDGGTGRSGRNGSS